MESQVRRSQRIARQARPVYDENVGIRDRNAERRRVRERQQREAEALARRQNYEIIQNDGGRVRCERKTTMSDIVQNADTDH